MKYHAGILEVNNIRQRSSTTAVVDWMGHRFGTGDFDENFADKQLVEDIPAEHVF